MLTTLLSGAALGFALSFMIGPVFFIILSTSVRQGALAGVTFASGVLLSDALYIFLSIYGLGEIFESVWFMQFGSYLGGAFLLIYGFHILLKKKTEAIESSKETGSFKPLRTILKGFVMNMVNPFVPLFWIGVAAAISGYAYTPSEKGFFYSAVLVVVFLTDSSKAYLASKMSALITTRILVFLNRLAAIALILFGFRLLWYALN